MSMATRLRNAVLEEIVMDVAQQEEVAPFQ